jgi:hypothetical protein
MTRVARALTATLALILALLPVAMERCRTACAIAAAPERQSGPPAHACHDTVDGNGNAVAIPVPKTCGHNIDARIDTLLGLTVSKARVVAPMAPAIVPATVPSIVVQALDLFPPGAASLPSRTATPRNLPLRL